MNIIIRPIGTRAISNIGNISRISKIDTISTKTRASSNLVELSVVLAILSILMVTIIPTFNSLWHKTALRHEINTLHNSLLFAKHYAMARAVAVFVCGSSDLKFCDGRWEQGYIMYTRDTPHHKQALALKSDPKFTYNPTPAILMRHKATRKFAGTISLHVFGEQNGQIAISKFGTTINNGHFEIRGDKGTPYCLSWNNRLRLNINVPC